MIILYVKYICIGEYESWNIYIGDQIKQIKSKYTAQSTFEVKEKSNQLKEQVKLAL